MSRIEAQILHLKSEARRAVRMAEQSTDNPRARKAWAKTAKRHYREIVRLTKKI